MSAITKNEENNENNVFQQVENKDLLIFEKYSLWTDYLREYETQSMYHFVAVHETRDFSKDHDLEDILKQGEKVPKLRWEYTAPNDMLPIPFNGSPYIMVGKREYHCHQGKDLNVKKKDKYLNNANEERKKDHVWKKRRKLTQPTKKLDCPVKFMVKKIFRFTEFKLSENSKKKREKLNAQIRKRLSSNISEENGNLGRLQYLVSMPVIPHQNHHTGEAASIIQPLDNRVEKYVIKQIRDGCRRSKDILSRVEGFVRDSIFDGRVTIEAKRPKFKPSRKKLRNLIQTVRSETMSSKVDQENIESLKAEWSTFGDVLFEPFVVSSSDLKSECVESDSEVEEESDDDMYFLESEKMIFVYQSKSMQRLYRRYAPSLILLDATYKTTKYALPLFFLVVRTNVNFQVVAVFVLQEESRSMIEKALSTVKCWNNDTVPKYGLVDFDEREITALEIVFPEIKVFLCDFHREQSWNRWVNKTENGVNHIAEDVKTCLRRIAHCTDHAGCQVAVSEFMSQTFFKGKLKNWFERTWLPQIKRWSLAYRPDDLLLCNTNNGTERLNEDLKYDELDGYKNCSLSEMLSVVIKSFIPKLYQKYVELNVKYSEGYKQYDSGIPSYLRNRPKQIINLLLEKMERVSSSIKVEKTNNLKLFKVYSQMEGTLEVKQYNTFLGDDTEFCKCTCSDFRRTRLLCKHFFAIFNHGFSTFNDLSPRFLNHPFMCLDEFLIGAPVYTNEVVVSENTSIIEENDDRDHENVISKDKNEARLCNLPDLPVTNRSNINRCKSDIRSNLKQIIDLTYLMEDDIALQHMAEDVAYLFDKYRRNVSHDDLPKITQEEKIKPQNKRKRKRFDRCSYRELPIAKRRPHPYTNRVGSVADMMRQFYRAKVCLPKEENILEETCTEEVVLDNNGADPEENDFVISVSHESVKHDIIFVADEPHKPTLKFDSQSEKEVTGHRLTYHTVNLAQRCLHTSFPLTSGFQDTQGPFKAEKDCFIQIIFYNSHWVTVYGESFDEVFVYDSLVSINSHRKVPKELAKQICCLKKCEAERLSITYSVVQQQKNKTDCGVFAIAFAVERAFGNSPTDKRFNVDEMRPHLLSCLKEGKLSPFPSTEKRVFVMKSSFTHSVAVYCLCRQPFFDTDPEKDQGLFMISCSSCEEWYHKKCEKVKIKFFHDDKLAATWLCSKCM